MKGIRKLDVSSFLSVGENLLNIDNDFYIFDHARFRFNGNLFKTDMNICCICLNGTAEGRINLAESKLVPKSMFISTPQQILEIKSVSDDFNCICIIMSERFVDNLGLPFSFSVHKSVIETPVIDMTDGQFEAMIMYCNMVKRVLIENHPNKSEIVRHLTCAFFYGIGYFFHQAKDKAISNQEDIVRRFLDEVQNSFRKERMLHYYASRLNITTKYLSSTVKSFSGKTASEWIDDYVILESKALLKSTNMTIQQISEELNFSTQSFFGKYFKRMTGMSPKEYRDKDVLA